MTDEKKGLRDSLDESIEMCGCEESDDARLSRRLKILRKLLDFLKSTEQEYLLSTVLEYVKEEYEEEAFCREFLSLVQEDYIKIRLVNTMDVVEKTDVNTDLNTAKQLI